MGGCAGAMSPYTSGFTALVIQTCPAANPRRQHRKTPWQTSRTWWSSFATPPASPTVIAPTTGSVTLDAIYAKIARRILPFLILLFVVAWLDRVNVGFAKLQMSADLHFSEGVFGFGAG